MKNKIVFITGASSGIGRETAYKFAPAGANLILTYNKKKKGGEETLKRCLESGAKDALLLKLDLTDNKSIVSAVKQALKKFGSVDIMINNAGTGVVKPLKDNTVAEIEQQLRTNLEGLIKITRAMLPHVRETIINVGSFLSKNAYGDMAVYCASKYGVRGFTQSLAEELPDLKICCVNPDLTATTLTGNEGRPPEAVADIIFKAAAGKIRCKKGGDVDVWEVLK
ncbi:MAG: SDR family oxidoreductase [Nitrospirae bacterium]|nr:SDR family oxidoreductase [Nitrospirota bacterium]